MNRPGELSIPRIAGAADVESGLAALFALDPRLALVAERAGPLPLRLEEPGYAGLARIVVGQMVSRASADAIWRRLEAEAGRVTAEAYLGLDGETYRRVGLSRAKHATLTAVALAETAGEIDLTHLCSLPAADAQRRLTAIRGVGPWTAEVYLLFCAGHPDIFPAGDIALQNAVAHALGLKARPAARQLVEIAAGWQPWRGVAARLFWAYYSREMKRSVLPVG